MTKTKSNLQWVRISGPDLDEKKSEREKENQKVLNKDTFKQACESAGVEQTKRQASKFRRKRGAAYKFGRNIK